MEAMAMGLPAIVTNYSGLTEFADDRTALLVKVASISAGLAEPDPVPRYAITS